MAIGAVSRVTIPKPPGLGSVVLHGRTRTRVFGTSDLLQATQLAEGERDPKMQVYLLKLAADWTSAAK